MRAPLLICFIWLLSSSLDLANALFFKGLKRYAAGSAGYGGYNYGHGGFPSNYGYNGYNDYNGAYNYNGGYSGGYGNGYPSRTYRSGNRQRTGRTYSDIAGVLRQDSYLGLGAGRYLPNAPYSHLWG